MEAAVFFVIAIVGFIIFCKFNLLKWACFLFSLLFALMCLVVTLILMYANPLLASGQPAAGKPWIILLVGLAFLVAAIFSLRPVRKNAPAPKERSIAYDWLLLFGGWGVAILGGFFFLTAIYSAPTVGRLTAAPDIGLWIMAVTMLVACAMLYLASRQNPLSSPNRMRWWALGITVFCVGLQPVYFALILIYTVPGLPRINFPLEASLLMLTWLPVAALLWGMARDRAAVAKKKS